jgi:hypothetical protein
MTLLRPWASRLLEDTYLVTSRLPCHFSGHLDAPAGTDRTGKV